MSVIGWQIEQSACMPNSYDCEPKGLQISELASTTIDRLKRYMEWKNWKRKFFVGWYEAGLFRLINHDTRRNATVAYPVQIVPLNFTKDFQRFPISPRHAIVGLLLVWVSESPKKTRDNKTAEVCEGNYGETIIAFSNDLHQTAKRYGWEIKIEILHTATERILESLNTVFEESFMASSRNWKWMRHTLVISYCYIIQESREMSGLKHGQTFLPCV